MDLTAIPIYDHHAHSLLKPEPLDALGFQRWFTESNAAAIRERHVPNTLLFRTALKWLGAALDCEPTTEAILAVRAQTPFAEHIRRLFQAANISVVLCDYGYQSAEFLGHAELVSVLPCRVERMLRLEVLLQDLILTHATFDQVTSAFVAEVAHARQDGYIALKSIAAYRTGLDIRPTPRAVAQAAFGPVKAAAQRDGHLRLASKLLLDYWLWLALEQAAAQDLPFQFHTGFGDSDADLRMANPLHLRQVIETPQFQRVPLVLLHAGWPYYRELAHLAAIYPNVWLDLSLAIPFATAGIPPMLRDILGMTPWSKVLFATDAFSLPEIFYIAARWGRLALGRVLDEFVTEGWLTEAEAWQAAHAILHDNAAGLYSFIRNEE